MIESRDVIFLMSTNQLTPLDEIWLLENHKIMINMDAQDSGSIRKETSTRTTCLQSWEKWVQKNKV